MADKGRFLDPRTGAPTDRLPDARVDPPDGDSARPTDREILLGLADAMRERGADPVMMLSGYLLTADPSYLVDGGDFDAPAQAAGRDSLLETLLAFYLERRGDAPPDPDDGTQGT